MYFVYCHGARRRWKFERLIRAKNGIDQKSARWFFQQLIIAVDYCHRMRVIDRDIKLENVLVESQDEYPSLKICDFGFSKHEIKDSFAHSTVGTVNYMAPEVFAAEGNVQYDGKKSDIWSCGVVLYTMYFGHFPFIKREDLKSINRFQRISEKVCNSPLYFPENVRLPEDLQDLLTKMLEKNPEQRITLAQIMEHRWFLTYLPDNALHMNDQINWQEYESESEEEKEKEEEIRKLFEQAKIIS